MLDPIEVERRASGMSSEEFKKMSSDPWAFFYVMAAILFVPVTAVSFFWALNLCLEFMRGQFASTMATKHVILPILTVIFAIIAFYLREIVQSLAYPVIEVGLGLATSAFAGNQNLTENGVVFLLGLLAGIRLTVDGFTRFAKFIAAKKPRFEQG